MVVVGSQVLAADILSAATGCETGQHPVLCRKGAPWKGEECDIVVTNRGATEQRCPLIASKLALLTDSPAAALCPVNPSRKRLPMRNRRLPNFSADEVQRPAPFALLIGRKIVP